MRTPFVVMLVLACAVTAAGCAKTDQSSSTTTASTDASASPEASASPAASASPGIVPNAAGPTATSSAAPAVMSSGSAAAPPSPLASVGFSDLDGVQGQKEIVLLAQLGVLDATGGAFHPGDPVKRRDFVRWLFKANNALWSDQPSRQIHAADATTQSSFTDLASTDPDFRYVQGLSDAGIAVGFPDKTFKADQPLTREQMIAIKSGLDRGGVDKSYATDVSYARYNLPPWKDKDKVSKTYAGALATDVQDDPKDGSPKVDNIGRTFGAIAMFRPQQPVTRAQAAVLLNVIGAHERFAAPRSAAQVLAAPPSASPTP